MSTSARENEEKLDRISNLPDELLCHVLSFLTTKEAGLTSVLSKRWRIQLAFIPFLDLNDSVCLHPEEGMQDEGDIIQSFMDSVDRTLALQGNSSIKKASLKFQNAVDSDRVNSWICNVLHRCVLDMDLFVKLEYKYWLPSEVFMSRTLVKLKIRGWFPITLRRGPICLPMLKTLALDLIILWHNQLQLLLSACPAIEELDMTNINFLNEDETVSSPSLKTLTLTSDSILDALSFDTPNLVCLKYSVRVFHDYSLVNLKNLAEAHIHLKSPYDLNLAEEPLDFWGFRGMFDFVRKLLHGICSVQKLYLSSDDLEMVSLCSKEMSMFNNLTFLDIDCSLDNVWQALPAFLQNCQHLETLVIKKGRSLASCPVKRLEIRGFEGYTKELDMIKHFLAYFPCLKEMEIHITDGPTPQWSSQAPLVQELNPEMLMRYNKLSGRCSNVVFKVHGSLPWTVQ